MAHRHPLSPPAPCLAYVKEDCSCFTRIVLRRFKRLTDSPVVQFRYGHKVRSRSGLRRGDLVFFKEHGYSHSHNPRGHLQRQRAHPARLKLLRQGSQLKDEVHSGLLRRQAHTSALVAARFHRPSHGTRAPGTSTDPRRPLPALHAVAKSRSGPRTRVLCAGELRLSALLGRWRSEDAPDRGRPASSRSRAITPNRGARASLRWT